MSIFWIQKVKFAIKDVKASIDDVVISEAMDGIITNNVFAAKGGVLASKGEAQIVVKFSNTTIAFDIFFDNIFTDWVVQNKIKDAISNVKILKRRVEEILYGLDNQNKTLKTVIENKRREYEILIENM